MSYGYSTGLIRDMLMVEFDIPYDEAQEFIDKIDERLNEDLCLWLETAVGKTFTLSFDPVLQNRIKGE